MGNGVGDIVDKIPFKRSSKRLPITNVNTE